MQTSSPSSQACSLRDLLHLHVCVAASWPSPSVAASRHVAQCTELDECCQTCTLGDEWLLAVRPSQTVHSYWKTSLMLSTSAVLKSVVTICAAIYVEPAALADNLWPAYRNTCSVMEAFDFGGVAGGGWTCSYRVTGSTGVSGSYSPYVCAL